MTFAQKLFDAVSPFVVTRHDAERLRTMLNELCEAEDMVSTVKLHDRLETLAEILEVQGPESLEEVAKDRMQWRDRHAKEAEANNKRAGEYWQRMKQYEQALINVCDSANALVKPHEPTCNCYGCTQIEQQRLGAQRMASIARNAIGAMLTDKGPGPR